VDSSTFLPDCRLETAQIVPVLTFIGLNAEWSKNFQTPFRRSRRFPNPVSKMPRGHAEIKCVIGRDVRKPDLFIFYHQRLL
jgi:hypothetical protein